MNYKLTDCSSIFKFSAGNPPVLRVSSGSIVELDTMDCFANQLKSEKDTLESLDWERVNPATGPVYVEGAEPGDVLKVSILGIKFGNQGVMAAGKDLGTLGELLEGLVSKLVPIKDGMAVFDSRLSLPLTPMIGVIGVAPEKGELNCGTPGPHGGNMDNLMVTSGAELYLPVFHTGALFALGDLHAVMGDGEIGVTGVEIAGTVTVKLEVVKGLKISNPVLANKDSFTTIASSGDLESAVKQATIDMALILKDRISLSLPDIAMLMSAAGHTQICQVVDPLRTARFVMPAWVLDKYGFSF